MNTKKLPFNTSELDKYKVTDNRGEHQSVQGVPFEVALSLNLSPKVERSKEESVTWTREAVNQCSDNIAEDSFGEEMNVSPQRRCYHGNYPGSTPSYQEVPLPSMMAFQHMPPTPSPSTAPHSASSAPGTSSTLAALGDASSFGQARSGSWESEGFMEEVHDMEEQQEAGTMRSERIPYIGGTFRTFDGTLMSTQSWHQPVSEEPGEMQFYSAQQQPPASLFAPQMQEPGPSFSGGSGYGSYDNSMGQMMTPSTAATPYYHNHSHPLAAPSSSYFMGPAPSSSLSMNQPQQQHLHQQQLVHHRHYESMGELNDRRTYPSGNHLSIMSSNLSPSDHMLHIYPSSMANR